MKTFLIIALTSLTLATGAARADVLIFDNYTGNEAAYGGPTFRRAENDPLTVLTADTTTTIDRIGIYDTLGAAGDLKFLVFSSAGTLLYSGASQAFAADAGGNSWKYSAPFSFTLQAGSTYYLGAIADVASTMPYTLSSTTQNGGITSPSTGNGNVDNFATPTLENGGASANLPIRLYSVVPEPSSLALLGLGLAGAVTGIRARRSRRH